MYIHLMFVLVIFAAAEREPEMTQKRTLDVKQLGAGTQFSVSRLVQLLDKDLVSMGHSRNGSGSTSQSNKRISASRPHQVDTDLGPLAQEKLQALPAKCTAKVLVRPFCLALYMLFDYECQLINLMLADQSILCLLQVDRETYCLQQREG